MEDVLVPIFICVVLPVALVGLILTPKINSDNKRARVLIKAIESNCNIDADKLAESLRQPRKTAREILNLRLLRGCIFSLIGIALGAVGIWNGIVEEDFEGDTAVFTLMFGGISLAIGLSYLVVYFVTRKQPEE